MYIFNELPTAFPWYDKLDKQQRFRENARQACDYRLISPCNALLPFQFKADYVFADNIFNPDVDFVDNSFVDLDSGVFDVRPPNIPENFARTDFINVSDYSVLHYRVKEAGRGYAIYDSNYTYISGSTLSSSGTIDVSAASFIVVNVSNNPVTRDYDKFVFALSSGAIPKINPGAIQSWKIISCCGINIDLSANISMIKRKLFKDGVRFFYKGEPLDFVAYDNTRKSLSLQPNSYYSEIVLDDGKTYYSEVFTVPDDRFKVGERSRYMRIDFWNDCDIEPIMYNDGEGGWKQYTYVDSYIHASEPEVEEDGERDGNDMLIPTFQRMVVRYRFSAVVPDFVKIALVSMQIHDNVFVTTENDTRSGRVERMSSSATVGDNGAYSTLDVVLEQYVLVKNSCCTNMDTFITE